MTRADRFIVMPAGTAILSCHARARIRLDRRRARAVRRHDGDPCPAGCTRGGPCGQPAPGGGTFEHFGVESLPVVAPANTKGQVAFFATLLRASTGEAFFLASERRTVRIAAEGDAVPGGGTFSGFGRHPIPALNERGDVAFAAAVTGGRTVEGIFLRGARGLRAIVVTGGAAPEVASGTIAAIDAPALNDHGDMAFLTSIRRGRETVEAVYAVIGGRMRKI